MKKRKEKKTIGMKLFVVLVIILCAVVIYATADLEKQRNGKLQVKAQLEAQIAQQEEEALKLDARQDYTNTRKFIEEMARKVLGLVYPDEILFEEGK